MDPKIERLIEITNKYYAGIPTEISDEEYDKLEDEVKVIDPNFNIKDHIIYADGLEKCRHLYPFMGIRKTRHQMHDNLRDQVISKNAIAVPKYDGSSLRAYYCDGKLNNILSRSNEWDGVNQTNKFRNKVIQSVPNWVKFIDYELLTSIDDFGDNARQKSNGLVNSKYLQDEVDKYAFACPFYVNEYEGRTYRDRMTEVCQGLLGGIPYEFPLDELLDFHTDRVTINGKVYPIDGIVIYDDSESDCPNKIFKFYSIDSVITKIKSISWNRSPFGYYIPKINLEGVSISGKWVQNVAAGSVDTLFNDHLCVGAEVEIVMAGLTIPQISKVISVPEVEDYCIPTCWDCGSKMERTSTGYVCKNPDCSYYVNQIMQPWGWNVYNKMEYAIINQGGLGSIDGYINLLRTNPEAIEITKISLSRAIQDRKLGEIILNCLNISRLSPKVRNRILGYLPPVPSIQEIKNAFDWYPSERAKSEIKIKLAVIIKLLSKLNELLKEICNLEIIKEG